MILLACRQLLDLKFFFFQMPRLLSFDGDYCTGADLVALSGTDAGEDRNALMIVDGGWCFDGWLMVSMAVCIYYTRDYCNYIAEI